MPKLPLLFRNAGARQIRAGAAVFTRPLVARGAAYGDFDRDGDLDVLVATNNGPAYLYRNDGGNRNHWLQVQLEGTKSNRDGIGAVVRVTSAGGTQSQTVHSGSSYCSASDLALTFGLGSDTQAQRHRNPVAQRRAAETQQREGRPAAEDSGAVMSRTNLQPPMTAETRALAAALWGRLVTCGGLLTRPMRRLITAAQDTILPHPRPDPLAHV